METKAAVAFGPGQDLSNLRQGMVSIFLAQAIDTEAIHVKGDLNRFRDFIYIDDVVDIWYKLANDKRLVNLTLNIGSGVRTTIFELLEEIKKELPNIKWKLSDMLHPHEANLLYLNSGKARDRLDWKPVWSFEESVKNTSNWYKGSPSEALATNTALGLP